MPSVAFKEWAVVCQALAEGRQSLILRKGGIAETGGEFRPEFDQFLLYPTYFHELHQQGIRPEFASLLSAAESNRPRAGVILFTHAATVTAVTFVSQLEAVLALEKFHIWSEATIRQRFAHRTPGLFVLLVRLHRLAAPVEVAEDPSFAGCKTWVHLDREISLADAVPVLSEEDFHRNVLQIRQELARV